MNLFKITEEYLLINRQLQEAEGELTPELEKALEINQENLEIKAKGYGYVVKQNEAEITMISEEIKRLQSLKKARTKTIERLKSAISGAMKLYKIDFLDFNILKLIFRKSERLEISNETLIPKKYQKIKIDIDKVAVKNAIKSGEIIKGAEIIEYKNLQIK